MSIFPFGGGVPAVPEQPNDGLVPPLKVLRKRLNGVYRADGFSGPTRRFVLIVALLVGLASLPTLAAITAGTSELDDGTTGAMDVPFLPPPSWGPVVPVLPSPSPPAGPRPALPDSSAVGPGSGAVRGHAGRQQTMPRRPKRDNTDKQDLPVVPGIPVPPGHSVPPNLPTEPAQPADPDDQPPPGRGPLCHERGKCGTRESRHHRPDWSRHRHCEESTHRAHWSHHREGRSRGVVVRIVPTGRHGHRSTIREHPTDLRRFIERHAISSIIRHRSSDRSEQSRRSTVTERPPNVRPARTIDRTHNSRRHQSEWRWDDAQASSRSYRGSHRAPSGHRADDAHDRSSRVGRHHADQHWDRTDRW
jgi:hypothetical protein